MGDSLFMFIKGIGPSHFIELSIWATHTESWGNWKAVRTQQTALFHFIMRQASVLGMYYRLPIQRWEPSFAGYNRANQDFGYGGLDGGEFSGASTRISSHVHGSDTHYESRFGDDPTTAPEYMDERKITTTAVPNRLQHPAMFLDSMTRQTCENPDHLDDFFDN